jgi:hypothetical protein
MVVAHQEPELDARINTITPEHDDSTVNVHQPSGVS